jgi:hypothetical protein
MIKLVLVALLFLSSSVSVYALEPGELPGPTSSDGGPGDTAPLPPTTSDGGWDG